MRKNKKCRLSADSGFNKSEIEHPKSSLRIFPEKTIYPHLNYTPKCFFEYTGRHFRGSGGTVSEDDRYFNQTKAVLYSRILHFYLEGITNK
jgi:hypothetical protein